VILRQAYLADTACECHGIMREAVSPVPEAHRVQAAMTLPPHTTRARSVAWATVSGAGQIAPIAARILTSARLLTRPRPCRHERIWRWYP
jgi:hypothetical protein